MTKAKAIDQVCKLRSLAKSTSSANEREVATKQAAVLIAKHGIKDSDLRSSGKSSAFDDIAAAFTQYTTVHPDLRQTTSPTLVSIIEGILDHGKKMPRGKKSVLVDQVNAGLKIAKFIFGDTNKTLNDVSSIVGTILKTYDV